MTMKHLIIAATAVAITASSASALDLFKKKEQVAFDYTAWTDTTALPKSYEGKTLFYPTTVEGLASISGTIPTGSKASSAIAAALSYAIDRLDPNTEKLEQLDLDSNSFLLHLRSTQGSNNTETTFSRHTMIEVLDNALKFTVYDLDARYREKGILPRTLPFERLNPATNSRHRELIEQFAVTNADYIYSMVQFINENPEMTLPNREAVAKGVPTIGMTPLEVKILLGNPPIERKMGSRTRWVYDNSLAIIFTDGVVSRVIN